MARAVDRVTEKRKVRGRWRSLAWGVAALLVTAAALPLSGYLYVTVQPAAAQSDQAGGWQGDNPRANTWRAVRQGSEGYTSASGPYTTNTLVQNGGQNWRQVRNGPVATYGAAALATVVVLIIGFFLVRGPIRLEGGKSGKVIRRWSSAEQVLHWYIATLFILLALTGLSMLFGRAVLIPVLGPAGFAAFAQLGMTVHNYLGPAFVVGVLVAIPLWMRHNLPEAHDWQWIKQAGGLFHKTGPHPVAGRNNAGEKYLTYWMLATVGLVVCGSGLVLDFPNFGQSRETMQLASTVHAIGSLLWMFFVIGHIYLAIVQEGTVESMTRGYVDVNWAKQHTSDWFEQNKDKAIDRPGAAGASAGVPREQPSG